ncbi:hypothetical protein O181_052945, partial [Austropuccinia psidii MF-1]|nr:hypothetical protein [Austropuccinia psidii MF-1]
PKWIEDDEIYGPPSPGPLKSSSSSLSTSSSTSNQLNHIPNHHFKLTDQQLHPHLPSSDELFISEHYPPIRLHTPFFNEKLQTSIGMGAGQPSNLPSSLTSLTQTWRRISRILTNKPYLLPELPDSLSYPVDQTSLQNLQRSLSTYNLSLPQSVQHHFLVHDGQDVFSQSSGAGSSLALPGIVWGLWLMSCEEVEAEWGFWRRLDHGSMPGDAFTANNFSTFSKHSHNPSLTKSANYSFNQSMSSCPAGWVRETYTHPGWLPLLSDRAGNYIGVDLSPPTESLNRPLNSSHLSLTESQPTKLGGGQGHGRPEVGQVIAFGREIDEKVVLWRGEGQDGWAKWLSSFADDLDEGKFALMGKKRFRSKSFNSQRRNSDTERGWSYSNQDIDEDEEDGLGEIGYFNDPTGYGNSSSQSGFPLWRLDSEYRGMSVIEALCARSKKRWAELGLYSSCSNQTFQSINTIINQPNQTPQSSNQVHHQSDFLPTTSNSHSQNLHSFNKLNHQSNLIKSSSHPSSPPHHHSSSVEEESLPTPIAFVTPPSPTISPKPESDIGLPTGPLSSKIRSVDYSSSKISLSKSLSTAADRPTFRKPKSKNVENHRRIPPPVPVSLDLPTMDSLLLELESNDILQVEEKDTEISLRKTEPVASANTLVSRLSKATRRFSEEMGRRASPKNVGGTGEIAVTRQEVIGLGMIVNSNLENGITSTKNKSNQFKAQEREHQGNGHSDGLGILSIV